VSLPQANVATRQRQKHTPLCDGINIDYFFRFGNFFYFIKRLFHFFIKGKFHPNRQASPQNLTAASFFSSP
jgi:hypothetical protein